MVAVKLINGANGLKRDQVVVQSKMEDAPETMVIQISFDLRTSGTGFWTLLEKDFTHATRSWFYSAGFSKQEMTKLKGTFHWDYVCGRNGGKPSWHAQLRCEKTIVQKALETANGLKNIDVETTDGKKLGETRAFTNLWKWEDPENGLGAPW